MDGNGYLILNEAGDLSKPVVAKMPKNGFYFDVIGSTNLSDNFEKPSLSEYKKELESFTDEDLEFIRKDADYLYKNTDYAIVGGFWKGGLGGVGSFADWMILLISEPDYVNDIFNIQVEWCIENLKLYKESAGDKIQAVLISGNDFGTQKGEFFSPSVFKELYVPHYKRINDWVHKNTNWKTFFHSCGSIANIIEYFIEAGVDILNPVQCSAVDMEPEKLKEKFGDKIVFWGGGVNTQLTLPKGNVEDVEKEVKDRIRIFAPNGGFVFGAVHNIQYGTPAENIVTMCDTVYKYGKYPI
jgi:uroporphyrinogen-III decarboxylase